MKLFTVLGAISGYSSAFITPPFSISMVTMAPPLDGGYAAFGKVIEGIETADAIVSAKRDWDDRPKQDPGCGAARS